MNRGGRVGREKHDLGRFVTGFDRFEHIDAVTVGHHEIRQHHIEGLVLGQQLARVFDPHGKGRVVPRTAQQDLEHVAQRTLVNINFPPCAAEHVEGVRVVRQGFHDYRRSSIVKGTDPRGYDYYWFGLQGVEHTPGKETDLEAIGDGFVSITPLQLDLTHDASLGRLADAYSGL